jgi:hypothetical protein
MPKIPASGRRRKSNEEVLADSKTLSDTKRSLFAMENVKESGTVLEKIAIRRGIL